MATELTRAIERSLQATDSRGRPLCVKLAGDGVTIKLKGERWSSGYFIPWVAVYEMGGKIAAHQALVAKQRDKELRRLGR